MSYTPILLPAVRKMLADIKGSWPEVEKATGIPYRTIQNIAQGKVKNPAVGTVEKLHHHLTSPATNDAA
jgi:DNA-binding Xre family transcriptional regulator